LKSKRKKQLNARAFLFPNSLFTIAVVALLLYFVSLFIQQQDALIIIGALALGSYIGVKIAVPSEDYTGIIHREDYDE